MARDGTLTPVLTPQDDPALVPRLGPGEQVTTPEGRDTASGQARRVRVVTARLPNGRAEAVLAIPLTSVDVATPAPHDDPRLWPGWSSPPWSGCCCGGSTGSACARSPR